MIATLLCLVVGISDGDTLTVRCGAPGAYQQLTVRVAAIDAPEKAQPFGQVSRQHLAGLCHQQPARISPRTTDRYGRTVADVECAGRDVARAMVAEGMAWVFDRYAAATDAHLRPLQAAAQASRAGLWRDEHPTPPWEWRRAERPGITTPPPALR